MKTIFLNPAYEPLVKARKWLEGFSRTDEVQTRYNQYLHTLKRSNVSPEESIIMHYFPSPAQRYALMESDFPYDLTDGLKHYILWSQVPMTVGRVRQIVFDQFELDRVVIVVQNSRDKQSLKSLYHVHIIVDEYV